MTPADHKSGDPKTGTPIAALLLLGVALCAAVTAIALPLSRALDLRETVRTQRSTLRTLSLATQENRPLLIADTRVLVDAASATRAGAGLQATLDDIARRTGVQVRSTQVVAVQPVQGLQSIGIELSLQGSTAQTARFLHGIETGFPIVLIDELTQQLAEPINETAGPLLSTVLKIRAFFTVRSEP
jgi:hypothetical protein